MLGYYSMFFSVCHQCLLFIQPCVKGLSADWYAQGGGLVFVAQKEADEFPDYLKIEVALNGFTDLTKFLDTLSVSVTMMEAASLDFERNCVERRHRDSLLEYIRR